MRFKRKAYLLLCFALAAFIYFKSNENTTATGITLIIALLFPALFKLWLKRHKKKKYLKSDLSKVDKMAGEEFELYLKAHFENLGYRVKHVGQTGDFGADLILTDKNKTKIAVQAKRYNSTVGVKAVQEIISAKSYYGCDKAMVVTNSFFTAPAIEMAQKCDVELWDRGSCKKYFK